MAAQFVSLALAYSLGLGTLRRKGVRKRPWLEIRRLETEATYLDHQVRALRRAAQQPIRVEQDMLPGTGYYDIARVRIQSPLLERAVELREGGITAEALQAAGGLRAIACLWLDRGTWRGSSGAIPCSCDAEAVTLRRDLLQLGVPCILPSAPGRKSWVRAGPSEMAQLARLIRPFVHRSMRHTLRPGGLHGASLL